MREHTHSQRSISFVQKVSSIRFEARHVIRNVLSFAYPLKEDVFSIYGHSVYILIQLCLQKDMYSKYAY